MPLPIYTDENPIVCATTAIRDALLKDPAYKVAGLSVQVGSTIWWLNLDLGSWSPASNVPVPLPLTITNAGGAVANEVVRLAAAGVLAKAQADTAAHASAVIGVYSDATVVPLNNNPIVKFDSTPVIGQPCYLSASTAGAMTSTAPASGAISLPPNVIALEDKSVGAAYAARVGVVSSIVSPLSLYQQFVADTAARLGVAPNALRSYFNDFDALASTGYPPIGAISWLITGGTHLNQTPSASTLDFSSNNGSYPQWAFSLGTPCSPTALNLLISAALSSQRWALTMRVKCLDISKTFKLWVDLGAGNETCGFGTAFLSPSKFVFVHANVNWNATEVSGVQYTVLGNPDTGWHVVTFYSTGDGTVHFVFDGVDQSFAMPASGSAAVPQFNSTFDASAVFDYIAFATV